MQHHLQQLDDRGLYEAFAAAQRINLTGLLPEAGVLRVCAPKQGSSCTPAAFLSRHTRLLAKHQHLHHPRRS